MSRLILCFSTILSLIFFSFNAFADDTKTTTTTTTTTNPNGTTTVEKRVIVTTAPKPKEVVTIPEGFVTCFTVKAGWYGDVWAADHNVCQYADSPEGVVWVQGYWVCNKYDAALGNCTNWDWKAAHWEKTVVVY